ncbi:MAG: aspartate--tRNA(Asn) ligase [Bacilli bacterium]
MKRVLIEELDRYLNQEVIIKGWLKRIRNLKAVMFIDLRDFSGDIQLLVLKDNEDLVTKVKNITLESVISVKGMVNKSKGPINKLEVVVNDIEVECKAQNLIPIDFSGKTETSAEVRLNWRYLDLRQQEKALIFKVQTIFEHAIRKYFVSNDFIEIHSPKITGAPTESGAEVFEVDYFGTKAYLTQSPQFYKQMAMAAGFGKVFEIGPVFRADRSHTTVHATDFTGIDAEVSWIKSEEDIMVLQEELFIEGITKVKEKYGNQVKALFNIELVIPKRPFPRIKMADAITLVSAEGHSNPFNLEGDLDAEGQKILSAYIKKHHQHEFVFITDFPYTKRPFYHMKSEQDALLTKSFDLLWNGVEITTGSQREHRYDVLVKQALEKGLNLETINFYLDFFKYGCPPHGGFGSGLARILMVLLGLDSIRETSYVFRNQKRLWP